MRASSATNIFRRRFSPSGKAQFDHNFSQGLNLQQTYGGGIGWSVIKRANESLDLKAGVTYIRQSFAQSSANQNLTGSTFEEDYSARAVARHQSLPSS